jgi:hypothetical protein
LKVGESFLKLLGDNIDAIKKSKNILIYANKDVHLVVKAEETK